MRKGRAVLDVALLVQNVSTLVHPVEVKGNGATTPSTTPASRRGAMTTTTSIDERHANLGKVVYVRHSLRLAFDSLYKAISEIT